MAEASADRWWATVEYGRRRPPWRRHRSATQWVPLGEQEDGRDRMDWRLLRQHRRERRAKRSDRWAKGWVGEPAGDCIWQNDSSFRREAVAVEWAMGNALGRPFRGRWPKRWRRP